MVNYRLILKSLKNDLDVITLDEFSTLKAAEEARRNWRRVLGGRNWTVDRRPGLDTLDHLAIKIVKV